jgi:hypothetical protein
MLTEVAGGVWVRQSAWVWTNSIVVREQAQAMAAQSASGIPLELIALVTPLSADGRPVPGEIIEHGQPRPGLAASDRAPAALRSPETLEPGESRAATGLRAGEYFLPSRLDFHLGGGRRLAPVV